MNYWIIAVCHGKTHIEKVKLADGSIATKQQVVNSINSGDIIRTQVAGESETPLVRTFKIDGVDYIRSVADDIKGDNLGNLPKFAC